MTIDDYHKMLAMESELNKMRQWFVNKATEIVRKLRGPQYYVIDWSFNKDRVSFVYEWRDNGMTGPSEEEYDHFPADWLFDLDWEKKAKARREDEERRYAELQKKYAEEARQSEENRERAELERLKAKYEGK